MKKQIETTLARNAYGELYAVNQFQPNPSTPQDCARLLAAKYLVNLAVKSKKIEAAYDNISRDRKGRFDGDALHHEIYDFIGSTVLVCLRATDGTRYGVKTLCKSYVLIRKHGRGVVVSEASKAVAAKAAKAKPTELGYAIAVLTGNAQLTGKSLEIRTGYKAVTLDTSGNPISVWDASPWPVGKPRIERSTATHNGGLYYYRTIEEVIAAAVNSDIFGPAREHKNLFIARVEAAGVEHELANGKLCVTKIKPIEIVAAII